MVDANSRCFICGQWLVWAHGHGFCANRSCVMKGENQQPCCQGEVAEVLPGAQNGLQDGQDSVPGTGRHTDKGGTDYGR